MLWHFLPNENRHHQTLRFAQGERFQVHIRGSGKSQTVRNTPLSHSVRNSTPLTSTSRHHNVGLRRSTDEQSFHQRKS